MTTAAFGADVFELKVPAPPQYIVKDLQGLASKVSCSDRKLLIDRCNEWSKQGDVWKTEDPAKPPFSPLLCNDPRRSKVESRSQLIAAAMRLLRAPSVYNLTEQRAAPTGFVGGIGAWLWKLSSNKSRYISPDASAANRNDEDDDGEAAETAQLTAPPKPKPKPKPIPKPKNAAKQAKLAISGGSFVLNEASECDPDDEEGGSSEDGFIDSDDDVEVGDEVAKKKAKEKRAKNRERRHSVSDSDDGSGDEESSADEGSMSDGSGSDEGSESSAEGVDDPIVKAKAQASEGSDNDDEQPIKRKPSSSSTAQRPKKRARVVEDEPEDAAVVASRSALFAQQQITSEPTKGKPDAKMGSKTHAIHANANAVAAAAAAAAPPPPAPPAPAVVPPPPAPKQWQAELNVGVEAASKRESLANKAESVLSKVAVLISEAKEGKGNVLIHSSGAPLDAFQATTDTARLNMAHFAQPEYNTVKQYEKCLQSMIVVVSRLTDAVQIAQKKPSRAIENAHINIGATSSEMLLDILPTIEHLQETIGTLSKKGHGMALRLASEQSAILALERK